MVTNLCARVECTGCVGVMLVAYYVTCNSYFSPCIDVRKTIITTSCTVTLSNKSKLDARINDMCFSNNINNIDLNMCRLSDPFS